MKDHDLNKESKGTKVYTPPFCEVFIVETHKILCASETENVGEYDYVTGQHSYFPWVSFTAKKSGYDDRYLEGYLLTSY